MSILKFDTETQADKIVFYIMVELYKQGHEIVSLGQLCEHFGIDKEEIPPLYYNEYYELDDFYKENPGIGIEQITNTLH
jgi:hypothetical protein